MQRMTTLTLTAIAGFIDTLSYVHAGAIFAAHVTGNFVVLGASLAHGIAPGDYFKLVSFPLFVVAVGLGAFIFGLSCKCCWQQAEIKVVMLIQALIFFAVALIGFALPTFSSSYLALMLVVAMGLQNSLHRYLPGPMTTVMTGSVMNWSAAKVEKWFQFPAPDTKGSLAKPFTGMMIVAFASGCALSGWLASRFGFVSCVLPGILMLCLIYLESKKERPLL
jgi:uncharacterized membrane protein YoaK (UPF0700 family)